MSAATFSDGIIKNKFDVKPIGIDLSEEMLKISKEKRIETVISDMRKLPFNDNTFDGVISNSSLVHLNQDDKKKSIKEVNRVLKENGIFNIWIQNRYSFPYIKYMKDIAATCIRNKRIKKDFAFWDNRYWWYPSKTEIKSMLVESEFIILEENNYFSRWLNFISKKSTK